VAEAVEAAPAVSPEAGVVEVVEVALEAELQLWRPVFASC
jgi:hypothetical protein